LLSYQTFLAYFSTKVIEGATGYQDYDTNNPNNVMILVQKNAGNIMALKSQIDDMGDVNNILTDISGNVSTLQNQVYELVKAQKQQGDQLAGSEPIDASDSTDNTNATDNANTTDNSNTTDNTDTSS
jgi:TolA-binding protein